MENFIFCAVKAQSLRYGLPKREKVFFTFPKNLENLYFLKFTTSGIFSPFKKTDNWTLVS